MATTLPKSKQWKLGTLAILPYDVDVAHNATVAGTLAVTGVLTATGGVAGAVTGAVTGNVTGNTAGTHTGQFRMTVNADLAAAGTVLADAAQLLEGFQVVTGANGTVGVKLPATPVAGTQVWIKGTTAGVLKVYPDAAATINAIGANGPISLTTGAMPSIFIAKSPTQWYTIPLVAS